MAKVTLTPEVREVLNRSTLDATSVKLPTSPRLDRKLYEAVNKVIEAAGGKWSKKQQAHVFTIDPRVELGLALETNVIIDKAKAHKKERQAFYTPAATARDVAVLADVFEREVLEPQAGHGALAKACRDLGAKLIWCRDIDTEAINALQAAGFLAEQGDFLETYPASEFARYERIVMNPPFTRKADAKHVRHAYTHWLKTGGLLTAIVCDDGQDRSDIRGIDSTTFKIVQRLPAGTFKESGTQIATLVIQLSK